MPYSASAASIENGSESVSAESVSAESVSAESVSADDFLDVVMMCLMALHNIESHCRTYEEASEEAARSKALIWQRAERATESVTDERLAPKKAA